ncbi:DinB family protein [Zunongwangia endophytica]|uniref:DinB family protein n=1 Tax=Zunongwangia endophytica TaxID=1808945 RepID=A0ABV8HAJ0_9FLAO|nr:DinB family protein [Zunongwangia endophytica]MDN3595222.1 DinB family protein [Zunongwangia endophytica]
MENEKSREVWLRGPLPEIPLLLQPAAHALLQSKEEVFKYTEGFNEALLWEKPAGRANVAFHLQHITGVLDRMLTYAECKSLAEIQFEYLRKEGVENRDVKIANLKKAFAEKVEEALLIFKNTSEAALTEKRTVGRKKLPSSVIGLYFHAAEHSQRHIGQMLVTISVLENKNW